MKITTEMLREKEACSDQVAVFMAEWPEGAEATKKNWTRAIKLDLDVTFVECFLSPAALKEYHKIERAARKEYYKIKRAAWEEYNKIRQPAWEEYLKIERAAWEEYREIAHAALFQVLARSKRNDR